VLRLAPAPSEELQIAARGQHVERWKSPRSGYPEVQRCRRRPPLPPPAAHEAAAWRACARPRRRRRPPAPLPDAPLPAGAPSPTHPPAPAPSSQGRNGYLKWRADLKRAHADTVAGVMAAAGYGEASIARVKRLINKLDLKSDPENQASGKGGRGEG
jgi:hypothetical protein